MTLVETGLHTQTGGRIRRVRDYIGNEHFMVTYGDGVADIDINKLVAFHRGHGKCATITAVRPPGRFGALDVDEDAAVRSFVEKPRGDNAWINGGFFVFSPQVFDYIEGDHTMLEQGPLQRLTADDMLRAYKNTSFWHAMDTLRDKRRLEQLWETGDAPWKVWERTPERT